MIIKNEGRGKLVINPLYRDTLREHNLDSYDALSNYQGGSILKEKGVRRIIRIPLPGRTLYLKCHDRPKLLRLMLGFLRGEGLLSEAVREWRAIEWLNKAGVATMDWAAYGERKRFSCLGPSYILTVEAEGRRLEDYVHFLKGNFRGKRCIIAALAEAACRLHAAGLNHRDFYLSHIFLKSGAGSPQIVLIDLQRVQRKASQYNRWVIKDLAELNYSAPPLVVTKTDRLRFLLKYSGLPRLTDEDRIHWRRIARKTERIRKHDRNSLKPKA